MKLSLKDGALYADNLFFCHYEVRHGSDSLQPGRHPVETRYSHAHGEDLPYVDGVGWIGPSRTRPDATCDLFLGGVRGRHAVIPCSTFVIRLLAMLDADESSGRTSTLVVE